MRSFYKEVEICCFEFYFIFSISFFTSFQLTVFLFDNLKFVSQSKILFISFFTSFYSIISSFFTSKRIISSKISSFSNFASEFVSKRSEIASIVCSFTFSHTFVAMQLTFFFKSIFKTFSIFYLTINDLFRMFVEKSKSIDLRQHENHQFFSRIFDISKRNFMQMRIIFYFLLVIKSTKFKLFISMQNLIKQSIRISFSRFFSFRFSFSIRFLFSTNFYFFFVCWRCQEFFVIYLHNNWIDFIVAKLEIFMKRRERRLFF